MDTLLQIRRNLLDLKCELSDIRVELKFRKWLRAAIKAGFTQISREMSKGDGQIVQV